MHAAILTLMLVTGDVPCEYCAANRAGHVACETCGGHACGGSCGQRHGGLHGRRDHGRRDHGRHVLGHYGVPKSYLYARPFDYRNLFDYPWHASRFVPTVPYGAAAPFGPGPGPYPGKGIVVPPHLEQQPFQNSPDPRQEFFLRESRSAARAVSGRVSSVLWQR